MVSWRITQYLGDLDTLVFDVFVSVFVFDSSAEGAGGLHNLWETSTHQCFVSLSSSVTLFLHTSTTFFLNVMSHQCVQIYSLYSVQILCTHIYTLDMCVYKEVCIH